MQFCISNYDLPEKEIKASFRSTYTHHSTEFAKFANAAKSAKHQTEEQQQPREDYLKNTQSFRKASTMHCLIF
ncbi:MAG: hypothetical protein IPP29_09545 [Bacteroidetes bacterium]|nr:hypothetical protein [Bacteroidota bacterium]